MERRGYLKGMGAVGAAASTAGCIAFVEGFIEGAEPDHEYVPSAWSGGEQEIEGTSGRLTASIQLAEGEYTMTDWDPSRPVYAEIDLTVNGNNPGEIFVIDASEEDRLRDSKDVRYYIPLHGTGSSITVDSEMDAGEYWIVVDNTEYAEQSPEGSITADFEMYVELY